MREHINEIFPEAHELFGELLFFSCGLPAAKPDPKAFRTLVTRLCSEPKRTLFIDDDEGYVFGAAEPVYTCTAIRTPNPSPTSYEISR